jgi:hypothetical protein
MVGKEKTLLAFGEQGFESAKKLCVFAYLLGSRVLGLSPRRLVKDMPPPRHTIPVWDGIIAAPGRVYFCVLRIIEIEVELRL